MVAPKSTDVARAWGSPNTARGTTSTTNGVANTNTLYGFGEVAHPAAYYCKTLTTGGYNTWYLPAKNELLTLYSNKSAVPFSESNQFEGNSYWSSTEGSAAGAWGLYFPTGGQYSIDGRKTAGGYRVRATRRSAV